MVGVDAFVTWMFETIHPEEAADYVNGNGEYVLIGFYKTQREGCPVEDQIPHYVIGKVVLKVEV